MSDPLDYCPVSDLPQCMCYHCDASPRRATLTEADQAPSREDEAAPSPPLTVRPSVRVDYPSRRAPATEWHAADWHLSRPRVVVCDHNPTGKFMCTVCERLFKAAVTDVEMLVRELTVALTKQSVFLDQGTPIEADPDEAVLEWFEGAAEATHSLASALDGYPLVKAEQLLAAWPTVMRNPNVGDQAAKITAAVAQAHRVIDRPPTPFDYGPCPNCGETISQERIPNGDTRSKVRCGCGYTATVLDHHRTQIEVTADQWRTYSQIMEAFKVMGEPLSKSAFDNLINRDGLPREYQNVVKWVGGRLVAKDQWMYRLSDIWPARRDQYRRTWDGVVDV